VGRGTFGSPTLFVGDEIYFGKDKLRDAIEATRGYVGTGGVVSMSATDHMGLDLSAFRMLEVKAGNWTEVK